MKKNSQLRVGFKSAKVSFYQVTEKCNEIKDTPLPNSYEFRITFEVTAKEEESLILFSIKVEILDKTSDDLYATLKTSFEIMIGNIADVIISRDEQGIPKLDEALVASLAGMCLGTTRGMAITLLTSTPIHNAIIPIIDSSSFFNNKEVFDKGAVVDNKTD